MKIKSWKIFAIIVALLALISGYTLTGSFVSPVKYDDFAKCLTAKGVVMYGAYWCGHCQSQKKMFDASWQYVTYIECDPAGENSKPEVCKQNNIRGYPTWVINGKQYMGEQTLETLSSLSGCQLG